MKKYLALLLLLAATASAQIFRIDPTPVYTTSGSTPPAVNAPMFAIPGATIGLFTDQAATMPATTYTSGAGSVTCPANAPVTLPGLSACQSTTGALGEFGFWVTGGTYWYTVLTPAGRMYGPFPVTGISGNAPSGGFWITGPFDNSGTAAPLVAGISATAVTAASADHDRFLSTNVYGSYNPNVEGFRPNGVTGDIHVPANSTAYEVCGGCFLVFNTTPITNAVGVSSFANPAADGPDGTADVAGLALHRLTGPCFAATWSHTINKLITINGADNYINTVADCDHLTLLLDAGTHLGIPWSRRLYQWGWNSVQFDTLIGQSDIGFNHIGIINEWDVGVYGPDTTVLIYGAGIGGTRQPVSAHGIIFQTSGVDSVTGIDIRLNDAFALLDNCCSAAISLGTATHGESGSMPIVMYARNSGGLVGNTTLQTDSGADFIINVGTDATSTLNPQLLFRDSEHINFTMTGTVGGARAQFKAFDDAVISTGQATFANLGTTFPGAILWCTNCQDVAHDHIVAGSACQPGGTSGALAIRHFDGWSCI